MQRFGSAAVPAWPRRRLPLSRASWTQVPVFFLIGDSLRTVPPIPLSERSLGLTSGRF